MKNTPTKLIFLLLLTIECSVFSQSVVNDPIFNIGTGFDNLVRTSSVQQDEKIIVGGEFTNFNGEPANYIARLNPDGTIDETFNVGSGFDGWVWATEIQPDGKILIGGNFSSYNGMPRSRIIRLNQDGSVDNSFIAEAVVGAVRSLCLQPDGKILVGGSFTSFNNTTANRLIRLNSNGSNDLTFNSGSGLQGGNPATVAYCISLQDDGKIIIGGSFSFFNGIESYNIVRVNPDGSFDDTFNTGLGFNNQVWGLDIQSNNLILVGGYFEMYNENAASHLARLYNDGTLDNTFDIGSGANGNVYDIVAKDNGQILVAGAFDIFNQIPATNIVQLNSTGQIDNSFDTGLGFDNGNLLSQIKTISVQQSGKIVAGGVFTSFQGVSKMNVAILIASDTTIFATICENETYELNGEIYSEEGQFIQVLNNQNDTDSVIILNLNFNSNDIISVSPNPPFGNAPLNVAFANQTQNLNNYNFTWYFGDGTSQQSNAPFLSHIYTQNGYADVTVVADNITTGCSSSQTFNDMIFVIGGVTCTHNASINQTGPLSGCSGDSILLSCNTDASFSYQWNRNGVPVSGATSSSFYPTQSGSYTVTIYQNNCPVTSASISVTFNSLPSVPTITSSGTITPCSGGSMTLTAPSGFTSYLWNTGSTASSLVVSQSGNYSVSVTNSNGCSQTSNPFSVNASFMAAPQVCIVGVDSLTNENRVVWEKPLTLGIDSFYVYKETSVSDVYTKIGATEYNDLAVFLDVNSSPSVQAYRYKISALDTCGVETNVGDFHKTIHLTINAGVSGAWNLIWSHYEGIDFGSYNIYRGTDLTNISLLTTIQSNLNTYTDLSPPAGLLFYQIEVVNPSDCDPTKIMDYSFSRSNIVDNGIASVKDFINKIIGVYPNPTDENIVLEITSDLVGENYFIFDFSGRIVLSGKTNSIQGNIDLKNLSSGIYYVSIENCSSLTKFIKN